MNEMLSNVERKEFTEFSKKVQVSLEDKLRNNPVIKAKAMEIKNFQDMQDKFAEIKSVDEASGMRRKQPDPITFEVQSDGEAKYTGDNADVAQRKVNTLLKRNKEVKVFRTIGSDYKDVTQAFIED